MARPAGAGPNHTVHYNLTIDRKNEFLDFLENGLPIGNGTYEQDAAGVNMTGVFAWLRNEGLTDTQFYTAENPAHFKFAATAYYGPGGSDPDWDTIPGMLAKFGPKKLEKTIHPAHMTLDTELCDKLKQLGDDQGQ